MRYYK